jgi:DNA gyrase inhibitor GyrI
MASGQHSQEIKACFQAVTDWVKRHRYDIQDPLIIGIAQVVNEQLVGFECCIQVSETATEGSETIKIKDLVGGRYAVVSCEKRSEVIGLAMQQFYQTYVPQHRLEIDASRPEYEIYYHTTLDLCIPIC